MESAREEGHWLSHPEATDPTDVVHFGQPPSAEGRVHKGPAHSLTLPLQQIPQNISFSQKVIAFKPYQQKSPF